VGNNNIKPFIIGIVICSLGAFFPVDMLDSTSWTTYSSTDIVVFDDVYDPYTLDYTTVMEIGLHEATLVQIGNLCYEDDECIDSEESSTFSILENPYIENGPIDCIKTQEVDEIELCETESAGAIGHSIILGGLGLLAFTFVLACIGVMGYLPGWVLKLFSSLAAIAIFVGPIAWFVMLPDLNSEMGPGDDKWGLANAFYLTLASAPVIFVGGFVFGRMETFAFEEDDDWDDDEQDFYEGDDEYSSFTTSMSRPVNTEYEQPGRVDVNSQGVWGDDGYEWIEHPEGSEIWYWRDQDTGQWVRH
tara:strand:- start:159 stop:1067 length:909 start_codon:yes stop_codon:yes gene_type:complete